MFIALQNLHYNLYHHHCDHWRLLLTFLFLYTLELLGGGDSGDSSDGDDDDSDEDGSDENEEGTVYSMTNFVQNFQLKFKALFFC